MNYLKDFIIPFRGLKIDIHHFDFVIGKKFFEAIEYAELKNGNVNVAVDMNRQERMLIFDFYIEGTVEVSCDRCLELYDQPIKSHERLFVKFGEDFEEQSDDVVVISENKYEFDISTYLYEYIKLIVPMQCIHPEDENGNSACNKEMLELLSKMNKP